MPHGRTFYRVILDSNLKISSDSNIVKTSNLAKTIIFINKKYSSSLKEKIKILHNNNIDVIAVAGDPETSAGLDISSILEILYNRYQITSILLESGPTVVGSFLKRGLIDKFIFFIAPKIIGGGSSYSMIPDIGINNIKDCINLRFKNIKRTGANITITAYPVKK
jgi:diaminohydroxyphosphoribosylaminopyrimidine deaminase/5-amino-6-(5-phosphoribosylamino)uracil reductase